MGFTEILFQLLATSSEKIPDLQIAPEALDVQKIERWFTGSVWTLVALNLLALLLFMGSAVFPEVKRALVWLSTIFGRRGTVPETAEPILASAKSDAVATEAPTAEEMPLPEVTASEQAAEPTETENVAAAPPMMEVVSVVDASPADAPIEETFVEPQAPADEPTEQVELPAAPPPMMMVVEESTEVLSVPANSEALPAETVSAETDSQSMSSQTATSKTSSFDATLDAAFSSGENTEEIPIFDTSSLDAAIGIDRRRPEEKKEL